MVHGLEETYKDKMKFEVRNYEEGDSPALIEKYELGKHGMVIVDKDGKAVWSEGGHKQQKETVEAAIKESLGI